jgi:hypothetical protein
VDESAGDFVRGDNFVGINPMGLPGQQSEAPATASSVNRSFSRVGLSQRVMSALLPKADMCGAHTDVGYGPIADMEA